MTQPNQADQGTAEVSIDCSMIKVLHIQRAPNPRDYSIERVFATVRPYFSPDVRCIVAKAPCRSRGVLRRVANLAGAAVLSGDVFHVTGDVHYLTMALPAHRTVLTVHDCGTLSNLTGVQRLAYDWFWLRLPVGHAEVVTCVSETTRLRLAELYPEHSHKFTVIPNAIPDDYHFSPKIFRKEATRILQVGTGDHKNLDNVAAALEGVDCTLQIVGRLSSAQRQVLQKFRIRYEASESLTDAEVVEAYDRCDVVVFASKHEGFGLPIIEANAIGRPVVTSDLRPMSEVAGGAACLVDPFDVKSIRQGICKVLESAEYRESLVQKGLKNVERFRAEAIARQYERLYAMIHAGSVHVRSRRDCPSRWSRDASE